MEREVGLTQEDKQYVRELFGNNKCIDAAEFTSTGGFQIRTHGSLLAKSRLYELYFEDLPVEAVAVWALRRLGYKWRNICPIFNKSRKVLSGSYTTVCDKLREAE